jgi:glutamyl-Q tRNA(Asp) synthetase
MARPVFRFAPSPNGYLHLGHALSALINFDLARERDGRLLLSIEDIDTARCRPQYEAAIYEDLAWLGIAWEQPVRRQSENFATYRAALDRLADLVYPSFESRGEIARLVAEREAAGAWPRDPDGAPLYPGTAKTLTPAERARRMREPYTLRLDMAAAIKRISCVPSPLVEEEVARRSASEGERERGPPRNSKSKTPLHDPPPQGGREDSGAPTQTLTWHELGRSSAGESGTLAADPAIWGDVVLARKETPTSYHLSVVVDDAAQGVTEVVRGQDLFAATHLHRLLQALLGLPAPTYCHHRLILDADGHKLAKSSRSTALRALRADGATPDDIRRMVGL